MTWLSSEFMNNEPSDAKIEPVSDIPAHWKLYNIYMLVPRDTGKVTLIAGRIQTVPGRWDFGKMPGASGLHAIKQVWDNLPHRGPALLDAQGSPSRYRTISRRDLLAEEVPKE